MKRKTQGRASLGLEVVELVDVQFGCPAWDLRIFGPSSLQCGVKVVPWILRRACGSHLRRRLEGASGQTWERRREALGLKDPACQQTTENESKDENSTGSTVRKKASQVLQQPKNVRRRTDIRKKKHSFIIFSRP